jgi:hypothetical protein
VGPGSVSQPVPANGSALRAERAAGPSQSMAAAESRRVARWQEQPLASCDRGLETGRITKQDRLLLPSVSCTRKTWENRIRFSLPDTPPLPVTALLALLVLTCPVLLVYDIQLTSFSRGKATSPQTCRGLVTGKQSESGGLESAHCPLEFRKKALWGSTVLHTVRDCLQVGRVSIEPGFHPTAAASERGNLAAAHPPPPACGTATRLSSHRDEPAEV